MSALEKARAASESLAKVRAAVQTAKKKARKNPGLM